ncbi:uncharacterized protein B0H18DRAFT_1081109 [Fomitopsis serialis]|uniref:uncharacterized protein n=1 Tax=Fomitopsis serialis TaxID=139415 RepID=UPI0020073EB4|nr:uncharacterized protein B0H18DRAFT_1081109 [Neoantrodia serialis]KAH9938446.1 hypothetical protein B0H18DRAFT_1081109 [Neoantrodia serialis]
MDPMNRSPALNPSSTPFFPGGLLANEEDGRGSSLGYRMQSNREQHYSTSSSLSISPSDYRSIRSSPSPFPDDRDRRSDSAQQQSNAPVEETRNSPAVGGLESDRTYTVTLNERRVSRSMSSNTDGTQDEGLTPGPGSSNGQLSGSSANTPPVLVESGPPKATPFAPFVASSSPASSLDSGSHFASSADLSTSFDAQLRASPFISELLDRLLRCEYTSREIQRDLSDVHRKVELLVERTANQNGAPEFGNPFAPNANGSQTLFSSGNGPRASMGASIAPNQNAPSDDITQISTRLNTLTTSVGQLLALQTQQMQAVNSGLAINSGLQNPMLGAGLPPGDLSANQANAPHLQQTNSLLGNGLPSRPEMRGNGRVPNPPMRTWSAGNLDIPMRSTDSSTGPLGRQDSMLRVDKRRSVSDAFYFAPNSLLMLDPQGESLASVSTSREGGPVITKWEQLNLAPDLLRSLNTFGVGPPNKIQQRALPFLLRGADIIAQAPPTQERIAAYVIPAIHSALTNWNARTVLRGPIVVMVSTTVDQATQAQRMIRDLGGPIGIKSALGVGATGAGADLSQELRILQQNMPHIICGTPQKLHALFTTPGGLSGSEVRFLVLDEVDQLIARNLHEFVFNIIKQLPPPRSRALPGSSGTPATTPGSGSQTAFAAFESGGGSSLTANFPNSNRRLSAIGMRSSPPIELTNGSQGTAIERQTALFSNTVPQDVLNLASAIQLREPVRVLVRRDGNAIYLYLAFTASGRSDAPLPPGGLGIIGSGRGATSAETAQAREWKLDALADLFDDLEIPQAIIHVGGMTALDAVVYKLASRGLEAVPLHGDMNAGAKLAALNKFRSPPTGIMRQPTTKVLVVLTSANTDLPKAVEEYAHRYVRTSFRLYSSDTELYYSVAPAIAPSYSRAGVVVNFVTATGGDVEMLRSIECFYKIKCPEVPMSLRDIV